MDGRWEGGERCLVDAGGGSRWDDGTEETVRGHHIDFDRRVSTGVNHLTGLDGVDGGCHAN